MYKFFVLMTIVVSVVAVSDEKAKAKINSLNIHVNPKGFNYDFETSNHLQVQAHGDEHNNVDGDFEWISPEGVHMKLSYEADENGYRPHSDLLPTPHPIPAHIIKALEYIKAHPYEEIKLH